MKKHLYQLFRLLFFLQFVNATLEFAPNDANFVCRPCQRPLDASRLTLPISHPPCLHAGQPVFHWPSISDCPLPFQVKSNEIDVDLKAGIAFPKRRICFFAGEWTIGYEYRCKESDLWRRSILKVGHEKFKLHRRVKRWFPRRRNPKHSPIHFQQDKYVVELNEDVPIRTIVVQVHATHASNQPLYYSMSTPDDSRSANLFALDTLSGEIRVSKPLDREFLAHHVLKLSAYERLDPQVSSSSTIIIDVMDVQDNSPIFEKNAYFAEIREDSSPGTTVLNVFARDLDAGLNGEVVYSLKSSDDSSNLFTINPTSGVIQIKEKLDREAMNFVRLNAVATDKGQPPRNSTALIEVSIIDVNDNSPRFTQPVYNVTIAENVTTPLVILQVEAKDADSGLNGEVHYSIVTSTSSSANLFSMDYDSGELTLRQPLDPRHSPYSLLIRAKDSGQPALSSTAHFYVHVLDINDHAPTFLHASPLHTISVEENVRIGYELGRLFAVDEDSGKNGEIRYRLEVEEGNLTSRFEIDDLTGVLRTIEELDREEKDVYNLKVIASDLGSPPLSTELQLVIKIIDQNDNSPKFEKDHYQLILSEDTKRGKQLFELHATDADLDQKITYQIEHMDRPLFALINLGEDSGSILSLAKPFSPLDEEIKLRISATDQGGLQGFTNLTLKIVDENSAPVFVEMPISIRVAENVPIGFNVLHVKAKDYDRGQNSNLIFSIDTEEFEIKNVSGIIWVAKSLDRERKASYSVTVSVTDDGTPPLSSSTLLEIVIVDVNDNKPKFLIDTYRTTIPENMPIGTSFLQVQAVDLDEGLNGIVDYFLNESDPIIKMDIFRLDRTSGLLQINKELDRETIPSFDLSVIARDRGEPSLESNATIKITLDDVNDNSPHFQQSKYDLWVAENSPPGTIVGTLIASDADIGENSHIDFKIFGGPDAKLFEIEADEQQNGVVRVKTRSEFDYEAKVNKYFVELQALSGQLSSTVSVTIHVSDINDNQPQLSEFIVLVAHFENEQLELPTFIGSIPAFDPDKNATLEYYLEPNELVEVDTSNGELKLKNTWRRQLNAESRACVSDGPNTVCSTCHIIYVSVDEEALRNSITVELPGLTRDAFLEFNLFHRFLASFSALDSTWLPEDIRVFSIESMELNGKPKLNVSFFISKDEQIVSPWKIEQADRQHFNGFDYIANVVHDELCINEPCPYYQQCKRSLKHVKGNLPQIYETDNFLFRSMPTIRSFNCICPNGFLTNPSLPGTCNQRLNLCYANSCMNNGTCVPLEKSYRCECPSDRTGEHCELSLNVDTCIPGYCQSDSICQLENRRQKCKNCKWNELDSDERCRLKSLSFGGNSSSFAAINAQLERMEWKLSLEFSTISQNAILLYSSHFSHNSTSENRADFFELSIQSGIPQLKSSLGGSSGHMIELQLSDWKENRIADGNWHTLNVEFRNWTFRMWLDDCDPELALRFSKQLGYKQCASEIKIKLSQNCLTDFSMPCQRFLDLRPRIYLAGNPLKKSNNNFVGCIRNLYVDSRFIDFSKFDQLEKSGDVQPGCRRFRPDTCELNNNCPQAAKCIDQWEGHLCKCPNKLHSSKPCNLELSNGVSLFDEESYVVWRLPSKTRNSILHFEFRTRERKTQIISMEFDIKSFVFMFSLEAGHGTIRLGSEQYFLIHPDLADGNWHSVSIDFQQATILIDHLYKKQFWQPSTTNDSKPKPQSLYSGNVPSSAYPHQFMGCLRNVHFGAISLKIHEQSKTKDDCRVQNPCYSSTLCPAQSKCERDWDRHNCKCLHGYIGDQCIDVCSINGLCRSNGTCIRQNSKNSPYLCECPNGLEGKNCEQTALLKECPSGWYGHFSTCQKCNCRLDRGFQQQCDIKNGACKCRAGTYLKIDRCVPCECGYGSENSACNPHNGQCQCLGESQGRRCDRCEWSVRNRVQLLDKVSLKCVEIRDRCPANIEDGIQWTTTMRGAIARQSCAYNQMGIATRECSMQGEWLGVRAYNCTLPSLYELSKRIGQSNLIQIQDAPQIAKQLLNITTTDYNLIRDQNLEIIIDSLIQLLNEPLAQKEHSKDSEFTSLILQIFDQLFDHGVDEMQFHVLISQLYLYGSVLVKNHASMPYLRPFHFGGHQLDFSLDRNEKSRLGKRHSNGQIKASTPNSTTFKSTIRRNCRLSPCKNYGSEVVMLYSHTNSSQFYASITPIQIVFQMKSGDNNELGWTYPECLRASLKFDDPLIVKKTDFFDGAPETTLEWSRKGTSLIGINKTHAICQFQPDYEESGGIFTLQIQPDNGAFVQFALANQLPYTAPLSAAFALFLCLLSLLATIFRSNIHLRTIRFAFIMSFILNSAALFLLQKMTLNSMFCSVRNSLLTYLISAQFIWIFILILNIYRLLCEEKPKTSVTLCFSMGLILPCLLSTLTFLFGSGCSLAVDLKNLWFIAGPMLLFLVLTFYALATSCLLTMQTQYEVVVTRYRMRKLLLWLTVLALLCTAHVSMALYNLSQFSSYPLFTEASSNILLVFVSIYIFIWANFLSKEQNLDRKNKFWLNDDPSKQKITSEPDYKNPLLNKQSHLSQQFDSQIQPTNEWIPDVMLTETYIHHTLQRSLQASQLASLPRQLLPEENPYQRYIGTNRNTSPSLRGSIGRSPKALPPYQTLRLTSNPTADDINDAYYEYTGRHRKPLPCSTFT